MDNSRNLRKRRKHPLLEFALHETPHQKQQARREFDKLRIKEYRQCRQSEESKQRSRELQKIRQRNYRKRLKESNADDVPRHTRFSTNLQRRQWREQKRNRRASMSRQKIQAMNARRREVYRAKKDKQNSINDHDDDHEENTLLPSSSSESRQCEPRAAINDENPDPGVPSNQSPQTSAVCDENSGVSNEVATNGAFRTRESRFRKKLASQLPKDPALKAELLAKSIEKQSPRSRKFIMHRLSLPSGTVKKKLALCKSVTESVQDTLRQVAKSRSSRNLRLKRLMASALMVRTKHTTLLRKLGVSWKLAKRVKRMDLEPGWEDIRKQRKDSLPDDTIKSVTDFFERGDVSHDIPNARAPVAENGNIKSRKVMESSLHVGYRRYKDANPNRISYSKFKQLRPKTVLPFTQNKFRECLCEYCVNIDLYLKAINLKGQESLIHDKYEASRMTVCPKGTEPEYKKECIDRKCEQCGTKLVKKHLQHLLEQHSDSQVHWHHWERVNTAGATAFRTMKVQKEGKLSELVDVLLKELEPFSLHLFNAKWQWQQYKAITSDVPQGEVVFCMDYAENYTCKAQDAPQGYHWTNVQCTIHPVVATYTCQECTEMVTDSVVFISDDLQHDQNAVQHFVGLTVDLLRPELEAMNKLIMFSDGAPTQYKSKVNFVDCSYSQKDFQGLKSEKHYFGSRHGKGPCDREIGVLKKSINMAVAAGTVNVSTPLEFYNECKKRLTLPRNGESHTHTRRRFIFVCKQDVNRNRPNRRNVKALKDTRKTHCVKGIDPHVVSVKERSCFCEMCKSQEDDRCENKHITGEWRIARLPCLNVTGL